MIRQKKGGKIMLTCIYVVEKIDGDYAELRRVDALKHDPEETKTVARALLPGDIMEGNKLLYENLQYRSSSIKRIKYQREQIYQF